MNGQQDCSRCPLLSMCWASPRDTNVMFNVLVCRLQLKIDVDATAKSLLRLLRPKLRQIGRWVSDRTHLPFKEVYVDLEAVTIEKLQHEYRMGEKVPPIVWLFDKRYGGVRHWAYKRVAEVQQERSRFVELPVDLSQPAAVVEDEPHEKRLQLIQAFLEDGSTLTTAEYRVFKFGLLTGQRLRGRVKLNHAWIAGSMSVVRQDAQRLFGLAQRKLERRAQGRPASSVPPSSRREIERIATHPDLTACDAALELGVSVRYVYQLRKQMAEA